MTGGAPGAPPSGGGGGGGEPSGRRHSGGGEPGEGGGAKITSVEDALAILEQFGKVGTAGRERRLPYFLQGAEGVGGAGGWRPWGSFGQCAWLAGRGL